MQKTLTDRELLSELAPVVETNLARHIEVAEGWQPHDLVPWADGRNFEFMGGTDWSPEQSQLSETAALALTVSVLVADNLPSYHRELGKYLRTGPWWRWVGRWTAEENRHEILIRNYLMVSRSVDPVALERARMSHMVAGFNRPSLHLIDVLVASAFEEAAAAVRHRNTAALGENAYVTAIANKLAADDELQAEFFADLVAAALDLVPDQALRAIADQVAAFKVPFVELPGGGSSDTALAAAGIYDPAREGELVFAPLLKRWNVFGRTDLGEAGEAARAELTQYH
ncbi:acyl-ACP desaturase [Nocardia camponoti]|uniref:Acyl-[acyl-carrier protein] desaturase n=1 Tax=Nocardia camponoti TaxID=1616106 RepID=A0A917QFB0_9NOCA|nr:acyl-ACP desaturase [Nocardia camponoti]GGK48001.1 putative acyl-[acyl-carrier protein] desaturase [Nocardia camponoti]